MKKISLLALLIVPLIWLSSCKSDDNKKDNETQDSTIVDNTNDQEDVQTFYLVPSPDDVFGFADDKNLQYNAELLNPTENLEKYNDTKSKEFNFGVYSADLAYCAASNKNDETVQYLNVVRELSQDIGLADVFNESLVYRIEHISPEKDSLISLSNDTYFDIIRYLERNDRPSTLATMAAGGWLECMYLVVNQTDYSSDNPTIQKIADQKLIVTNLEKFLEQEQDNPNIKAIIDEFQNIFKLYSELEVVETQDNNAPTTDNNETIIVVGGHSKFVISEEQYKNLKKYIIDTRNNLTKNNVSL